MARHIRGLESRHEQKPQQLLRDTRPLTRRFYDFIRDPNSAMMILVALALASFFLPGANDIFLLLGIILFFLCEFKHSSLPFRLPQRSGILDYNDLKPGSGKPNKARGICFYGNETSSGEELWFNNEDMRTHTLIFGSTGAGKTETLVSLAYNALVQGSGFIYVDGKGDNSLFAKVFSMARAMGREDDILLINFMTGARDIVGPQAKRISNTMNPFSLGSSSMCAQLVISMMDSASGSSDGDMWKGRAISFVEALMRILCYARDKGYILLDANSIRQYFHLPKLESIVLDKKFPVDNERTVSIEDAPDVVLDPITNYLLTLPGFDKNNKGKQRGEVFEQHGFIVMQLTRVFTSLADTYGHILRVDLPEVDFRDVVLNRRILVALLPALEKSPEELSNLGKIIVASLKAMMASGLGEAVEGTYAELIEKKVTTAPTPFLCILDEYGYYAVKGFAVVPAQARSLGFSAIFAGQDLPAFQKASKEEALSIGANTNIKIAMKLEDPIETWDFFNKTAGEALVTQTESFQTNQNSMTNTYLDTRSARVEKRARVDLLDLKDQDMGEMHIFFKSKIVRAKSFFANPKPVKKMRLNQFLKVKPPSDDEIVELLDRLVHFEKVFKSPELLNITPVMDEDLLFVLNSMQEHIKQPIDDRTITGVKALYDKQNYVAPIVDEELEAAISGMDILTQPLPSLEEMENIDPLELLNMPTFAGALLDKNEVRKQVETIERFYGVPRARTLEAAVKILKDLRKATKYPPGAVPPPNKESVIALMNELSEKYEKMKEGKTEEKT